MPKKATKEESAQSQGFEVPIDQETAGKILDSIYKKALNGIPKVSRSVDEMVNDYINKYPSTEEAAKSLTKWQIMKCGTSGFLSSLGGFITLPVAIPANISSVVYIQMRMIACIAKMGGYDIRSDQVQTMVYMCLTGTTMADLVMMGAIKFSQKSLEAAIKKIPGAALVKINQRIGFRFLTKFGEKDIINLGKMVPLAGGLVGGGLDVVSTNIIANYSIKMFLADKNSDYTSSTSEDDSDYDVVEVEIITE